VRGYALLPDKQEIALAKYRLAKAKEAKADASMAIGNGSFNAVANRSYYAIFHAMRAVLATNGYDSKKHSGIIAEFNKSYVKTGVFPASVSEIIKSAFTVRGKSDYDDFYVVSKAEVADQIGNAETFLRVVEEYLDKFFDDSVDAPDAQADEEDATEGNSSENIIENIEVK
jgi:uncharacterized protein (UPF0332 family)